MEERRTAVPRPWAGRDSATPSVGRGGRPEGCRPESCSREDKVGEAGEEVAQELGQKRE